MGHYWEEGYCYGVTGEGAERRRFRSRYRVYWGALTDMGRDAEHDSGEDEWRDDE